MNDYKRKINRIKGKHQRMFAAEFNTNNSPKPKTIKTPTP